MARKVVLGVDNNNQKLINVASPADPTDAANKSYVDNALAGLSWKSPVAAATTTNGTLASAYANGSTIDGVALTTGMRILIKDQSAGAENGIYTVNASGAPTRATDADSVSELQNATVFVEGGTVNADKGFTQTANVVTLGTTLLTFVQFNGGGSAYTAGDGLALSSTTFRAVAKTSGGLSVASDGIAMDATQFAALGLARKFAEDVPSGSTTATITHSLGTKDVSVTVVEVSTGAEVEVDVVHTTTAAVTLSFAVAPTTGQYHVTVIG